MPDPNVRKIQREAALSTGAGPKAWDMVAEAGDVDLTAEGPFPGVPASARFGYVIAEGTLSLQDSEGNAFDFLGESVPAWTPILFSVSRIVKAGSTAKVMFLW